MSKIAILAICLVTVSAVVADPEKFTGTWTPVVMYPTIVKYFEKACFMAILTASDKKCTCEDGKEVTVLEARLGRYGVKENILFPLLVVDSANDVASSLNVTCTCDGKEFPNRGIVRSVSSNYFIMYRIQDYDSSDPNGAVLLAREIPSHQQVLDVVKSIEDLRNRAGSVICDSEVVVSDPAVQQPQHSLRQLTKILVHKD